MTRVEATGPGAESTERDLALSLVRDDVPLRLLRRVGLVPSSGLGVGRRAVFFALLAWLPIAIWAVAAGRALPGGTTEPCSSTSASTCVASWRSRSSSSRTEWRTGQRRSCCPGSSVQE